MKTIGVLTSGGDFTDLCAGPHVDSTGRIKGNGIKLTACNAAYWRGDSNRQTLQRIYGVAFPSKDELDAYLKEREEAVKRMLQYGTITTPAGQPLATRLLQISRDMEELIAAFQPEEMSIEELFFSKNITTGIAVAHARGVILCAAEKMKLPVYEYTPMQVKQAVVGYGLAEKKQVMDMTRRLLKLKAVPRPDDAADALAIALCHARSATSLLRRTDPNVKETV